jgi:hypothetical protein
MGGPVHSSAVRLWFEEHYGIRLTFTPGLSLAALADNDNFQMHKKQRLIDPSGKLSDEFAAAGIRLGQKIAQAASSKPAATSA